MHDVIDVISLTDATSYDKEYSIPLSLGITISHYSLSLMAKTVSVIIRTEFFLFTPLTYDRFINCL